MTRRLSASACVLATAFAVAGCRSCKEPEASAPASAAEAGAAPSAASAGGPPGWSLPIAAANVGGGEVLVAGLDVPSAAIRMRRIGPDDAVLADRAVLEDVRWSADADLRVVAAGPGGGGAVTWRGLRDQKLGRALVVVGGDLAPKGPPVEVAGPSCATRDALWFTDGKRARGRAWSGASSELALPSEGEPSIVCAATRAFALFEQDDAMQLRSLPRGSAVALLREGDFGDDEPRERAEYTVGDDVGIVRVGASGSVALRETKGEAVAPVRRLRARVPADDDLVAVDASPKAVVIVHTSDASDACRGPDATSTSTKVKALRVDRETGEETAVELSPGACGREVGPFFTGAVGDAVSVAWVERGDGAGEARAPVVGLSHARVRAGGAAEPAARIEVSADALVDAGCDEARCYAAALVRATGTDGMVPGPVRVLRY